MLKVAIFNVQRPIYHRRRFLGHGSPGSVAVLGKNRQTLDFSKPHTMDAAALYTWDFAAQQRTAYTLRFQPRS
jgi:hypothetical protein